MNLVVPPPVLPMLAKRVDDLPDGPGWIFEPKWDGFRVLVFRDGDDILLQSRDGKPLGRYFPELLAPLAAQLPDHAVLDGEIVIARGEELDFEALQMRLHPAASRVKLLASEIPAGIVFFDLLCEGARDLRETPFSDRRGALERLLAGAAPPLHITPATRDLGTARDWFRRFEGAGLDGVMAKHESSPYEPNKRTMLKIKHERECDCVVAGFRWHKDGKGVAVGSLLLGLFDDEGHLQHVGVCSSFTNDRRRELVEFLAPYRAASLEGHPWQTWAQLESHGAAGGADASGDGPAPQRRPGGGSRWSQGKDLSWEPLRPELVVEVAYDHMQGARFRHIAHFRRWHTDKPPRDCTYAQLEVVPPHELAAIFSQA